MNKERSGWRDEWISDRHRRWGFDLPITDIDFLVVESNKAEPKALIEYKEQSARMCKPSDFQYRVLVNFAAMAKLPLFGVRYSQKLNFAVTPLNEAARKYVPEKVDLNEIDYVAFLHRLRGREVSTFDIAATIGGNLSEKAEEGGFW